MDIFTQHLYIYLMTCQYINISGIFQLSPKKVCFEAKLTEGQFEKASGFLSQAGRVYFYQGWVYIVKAVKNNNYVNSPLNKIAYERELSLIPASVKTFFDSTINSSIHSSIHTTHNPKTINNKQEIINKKEELTQKDFEEIAERYNVPTAFVMSKWDDILNYCASTGKKYRDYKATLRNWVKKDAVQIAQSKKGVSAIDATKILGVKNEGREGVSTQ